MVSVETIMGGDNATYDSQKDQASWYGDVTVWRYKPGYSVWTDQTTAPSVGSTIKLPEETKYGSWASPE